jgi:hypothetical protein
MLGQREVDIDVLTGWSDTPAQMKTKIQNAIVSFGNANGYSALTSAMVIMPTFTKG